MVGLELKETEQILEGDQGCFKEDGLAEIDTGEIDPKVLLSSRDKKVIAGFKAVIDWHARLKSELANIRTALANSQNPESSYWQERVEQLRDQTQTTDELIRCELLDHQIQNLNKIYELRAQLGHALLQLTLANQRYRELERSESHLLGCFLLWPLRVVKRKLLSLKERKLPAPVSNAEVSQQSTVADQTEAKPEVAAVHKLPATSEEVREKSERKMREIQEEHAFLQVNNPFADVNNRGTGLAVFRNWVSVYHYQGARYGSNEPLVSDQLPSIYTLNQLCPLAGKNVLDLGSLEGANSKQMIDLGAAHVTGIEFSKEAFLKSLIIKNEFKLDCAEFICGDINVLLKEQKVGSCSSYDIVLASGLLYHMEDPIETIDLITSHAPIVYVVSHVANEFQLAKHKVKLLDRQNRGYFGARHQYGETDKLGGTGRGSVWLAPDEMLRAFSDRGFEINVLERDTNYKGDFLHFLARRE